MVRITRDTPTELTAGTEVRYLATMQPLGLQRQFDLVGEQTRAESIVVDDHDAVREFVSGGRRSDSPPKLSANIPQDNVANMLAAVIQPRTIR